MVDYFTIAQSQTATNITLNDPTIDGFAQLSGGIYTSDDTINFIEIGYSSAAGGNIWRGFIEWDISSIPSNADITQIKFIYNGLDHGIDCYIRNYNNTVAPSSEASDKNLYDYCTGGGLLYSTAGFPVAGINKIATLGALGRANMEANLAAGRYWFALAFISTNEATNAFSRIYSEDYSAANPKPTLYVEYNQNSSVTLSNCGTTFDKTYNRNLEKHLFRDGTYKVHDVGKQGLTVTLTGVETTSATTKFASVYNMMTIGEPIVLSGFTDTSMNTSWYIDDFQYAPIIGTPNVYNWKMTLQSIN